MRILATNDDGIFAEGFKHLVSWATKIGDVTICAPKEIGRASCRERV